MKLKKILLIFMATIGISFTLAACGNSSSSKKASNSKEITFWNVFVGADGKNMQKLIADYNKTNPEYKVKNVSMKEADMYTKIPTVVNSGKNIPDLTIVHAERIKLYKKNNMLQTFDDSLEDYPQIKADNYVPEAWNIGELDGKRYSVPLDIHTFQLYYNKKLVEKYAPHILDDNIVTFDEFKEAATKAKKDKVIGLGLTWFKPNFLSLYAQHGGELTKNGTDVTLDNDQSRETLNEYVDLRKAGLTSKDGDDPAQLWLSGNLMFYPEGIWMQNDVKQAKFDWGMANSLQLSDDIAKTVNWSSSHQFVMFKSKERNKAKTKGIMDFLEWVRKNSLEWARSGQNPATLALQDNKEYKKMPQSFFINSKAEQDTLKIFDYTYNGYVADALDKYVGDALFGKTTVEKTVTTMQKEVQGKIDKDQE